MNAIPLKHVSTLFLKAVLVVIGSAVTALCVFSFWSVWHGVAIEWPGYPRVLFTGILGIYATAIPFLFALYQAFKLLKYIDKNTAFSELSINALNIIKYCAVAMTALYATALPLAYVVAELDDAPGLIIISTACAAAPLVVATFAAVLQKLVQSAIALKQENDLTI